MTPLSRWKALGLGMLATLVCLELGLRAVGVAHRLYRGARPASASASRAFTILCYGNSHTEGIGAPPGHSYCDYLRERIAREAAPTAPEPRVFNRGASNLNSAQVLQGIEEDYDRFRPDLALIMTGGPNEWNWTSYRRFLDRQRPPRTAAAPRAVAYDACSRLAVFRLGARLLGLWRARRPRSLYFPETPLSDRMTLAFKWLQMLDTGREKMYARLRPEDIREAVDALEFLAARPEGRLRSVYSRLGEISLIVDRDPRRAARWFRKSLAVDPELFNIDVYFAALRYLRETGDADPAAAPMREVMDLASRTFPGDAAFQRLAGYLPCSQTQNCPPFPSPLPGSRPDPGPPMDEPAFMRLVLRALPEDPHNWERLAAAYEKDGRYEDMARVWSEILRANPFSNSAQGLPRRLAAARELSDDPGFLRVADEALAEHRRRFPDAADAIQGWDPSSLNAWIASDIEAMAGFLRGRGAAFMLQTYPPNRGNRPRPANRVVRLLARTRGYPLSDTDAQFRKLFRGGVDRERYYSTLWGPHDSHLNAEGNKVLADLLFEELKRQGLLRPLLGCGGASTGKKP